MNRFFEVLKRHSPTILSVIAAVGTVVTAVLAAKETPKALMAVYRSRGELGEDSTVLDDVKAAAPFYIPAASAGLATVACILGANVLNRKQQASLAGAYALLDRLHKEYREKVAGLFGEEADHTIERAVQEECAAEGEEHPGFEEKQVFYEEHRGEFFERTMKEVLEAEYHINRNLALKGEVTLNEFYEFLGLGPTEVGNSLEWNLYDGGEFYGYSWIDFSHRYFETDDGLRVCALEMPFAPHPPGDNEDVQNSA
jgi:hypothetical protein